MLQTFMDTEQKKLLKKFHTLLGKCGIGQDGKEAILCSYGVESSRDLTANDLLEICNRLLLKANPELAALDKLRKKVIRLLFMYYELVNRSVDMDYVKATACRSTGYQSFNEIPKARLNNILGEFRNKVKDIERIRSITKDDLLNVIHCN